MGVGLLDAGSVRGEQLVNDGVVVDLPALYIAFMVDGFAVD